MPTNGDMTAVTLKRRPPSLLQGAGLIWVAPLVLTACAGGQGAAVQAVSAAVEKGVGAAPAYAMDAASEADIRARVATLLAEPLAPETAVRIALAQNPRVTAAFEELGVARADFLNTVLPAPPLLGSLRLIPDHADEAAVLHQKATLDLLGLLTLPARLRAGVAEREAAKARTTMALLAIAAEARSAMIACIAAQQEADLMAQAADVADAAADAADALYAAGNIAAVERDRERLFAEEVALSAFAANAARGPARERVNIALGLDGADAARWRAMARLPIPPETPIDPSSVEAAARAASLDLAIAAGALRAAESRAGFSWLTSLLPGLALEGEQEREDGAWKRGFGLDVLAPLFDLGGAERLRRGATVRRDAALRQAVEIELGAQARLRAATAEAARQIAVRRREVLLPLSGAVFEGAEKDFNAMEISLIQLIEAKRQRLEAGRAAVAAVRDYWFAQAELDMLMAGGLSSGGAGEASLAPSPQKTMQPGH
jgi:outer membrane protein TolC